MNYFEIIDNISEFLPLYLLVFSRISALALSMPIIGFTTVPPRVRIYFAVLLTFIIVPNLTSQFSVVYNSILPLALDIIREIAVGLLIGFGARLVFEGFSVAGAYIGLQMGMAIMNVFDPSSQNQQPIISSFWMLIIVTFFLITNSHYFLMAVIFENFKLIQVGTAEFNPEAGHVLMGGGVILYQLALKFAAPTMLFLLTIDIAIALMSRVMPQLNIFFISLPLKIGAGIFLLTISLKIFQGLFSYVYNELEFLVSSLVRSI
jgi:flagellar biosynthetic protein FliR